MLSRRMQYVATQYLAIICISLACIVSIAGTAHSAESVLKFDNDAQAELYQRLTEEFRCLKCQNQNLADSNAGLAQDLRNEIHQAVLDGQGRDEIADYLVARYGDFVLYRPPVKRITYLLWFGPFLLLLFALIGAVRLVSKKPEAAPPVAPSEALDDARRRLND